jgi:hypothetical protein
MSNFKDKRKLIVFVDDNNNSTVDAISFASVGSDFYLTQFYIEDNILHKAVNKNELKNNIIIKNKTEDMNTPDLSLPPDNILLMYNIKNYDELIIKIKEMINNNTPVSTIYRIVTLYIYICFDILKKDNNTLMKILKMIFSNNNIKDNKIELFVNEWFSKKNIDSFNLNICEDFHNFFSK